jgi:AraC-like DNA-binding protein
MRRALTFMREHLAERLTLAQLARVAGFAPTYFSKLLRRGQGVTLDQHLQGLRLARAKQILATSTLTIGRVAELSGFRSRTYFQQVFRRRIGVTPIEYRRRTLGRPLRPYEPLVPGDRRHEYPSVTEKA